ncbi:ABC transporter substrate-binding protein [Rhodococcus sp. HNM0563]|uniref:ABC transporter substrate-binding protein n=1 Tax=Rhodococcus sp. HNM0563 TaxID=2716339 RepID=UPI00146CACD1|nr:ABC transporter substrate-binding protein [Rhodococcus sp. HNM0563]NLU65468.1 ABC transporter substrate-binding protein [Rhodococcus sp. HNM0563]
MKRSTLAAALAVVGMMTAGCTSTSAEDETSQPTSSAAESSAFPTSVTGALGTVTIDERPERVVAMSWTDADILLSLGVTPVAIGKAPNDAGVQPWTDELLGDGDRPAILQGVNANVSIEEIAAQAPDLIVGTKSFGLDTQYEQLSALAPVVHYAETPSAETWQEATTRIATALGIPERGTEVVEETEAAIADSAAEHPALAGKTYTFFVGPQPDSVYIVNSTEDAGAKFLDQLGLTLTPFATSQETSSVPGRALLSYENVADTDADIIVATSANDGLVILEGQPAFASLDAIQRGAYVPLAATLAQSIAFPSPPSLDWALGQIVPELDEAAQR